MKALVHEDSWNIEISWSRPIEYTLFIKNSSPLNEHANLYFITARYGKKSHKIIYIGKSYSQSIRKRFSQPDHKLLHMKIMRDYPRHKFYVSLGVISVNNNKSKITKNRIDEIERILIYSTDQDHKYNVKNFWGHKVTTPYRINNIGYRCNIYKDIALGIFVN